MSKGFIGVSLQRSQALHNPYVWLIFTSVYKNEELFNNVENFVFNVKQPRLNLTNENYSLSFQPDYHITSFNTKDAWHW